MSFIFNDEIRYADSPNIDAFGRLRVSNPVKEFASTLTQTSGDTYYETILSGSATSTLDLDKSEVALGVTGSGDIAIRQQHGYNFYQPGNSQLIFLTGVFGSSATGVAKRMGYFDDEDGMMFELSGSTFGVKMRTSTSGAPVDTFVAQADWNIDTLDTGNTLNPSGYHLDVSKTNIYVINFQWLGVGRVVFALDIDGVIVPVHQVLNANNKTEVYIKTGNLPVRYEVVSSSASDSTFKQICASVLTEGGDTTDRGFPEIVSNGLSTRVFSSRQSVVSLRLKDQFNGRDNRVQVIPTIAELITTTSNVDAYWELVLQRGHLGETNLGGSPTWTGIDGSPLEYSTDGTTVTGGVVIDSGHLSVSKRSGVSTQKNVIDLKTFLSQDFSSTNSDYLHLVVTPSKSSAWAGVIKTTSIY